MKEMIRIDPQTARKQYSEIFDFDNNFEIAIEKWPTPILKAYGCRPEAHCIHVKTSRSNYYAAWKAPIYKCKEILIIEV